MEVLRSNSTRALHVLQCMVDFIMWVLIGSRTIQIASASSTTVPIIVHMTWSDGTSAGWYEAGTYVKWRITDRDGTVYRSVVYRTGLEPAKVGETVTIHWQRGVGWMFLGYFVKSRDVAIKKE